MQAAAGTTLEVPIQVVVDGDHVDPDGNTVTAVLSSHPSASPTITRRGVGRYVASWSGLDPQLTSGTTVYVDVDGAISGDAWTTWQISINIEPSVQQLSDGDTLDELASLPKKTQTGSEMTEEHSLADQIAYDKHKATKGSRTAEPEEGRTGLPIFRSRFRHGRP